MTSMAKMIGKSDGSGDVVVWLKKVKLAGELQKMGDLSLIITLFLEGDVFALYEQLSDNKKPAPWMTKKLCWMRLRLFFSKPTSCSGIEDGTKANSLMYIRPICFNLCGWPKLKTKNCYNELVITGLPGEISKQLQSQVKIFGINLKDVLNHARVLLSKAKEECLSTTISEIIKDKDFDANFDGMKWTAKYKWKQDEPQLNNFVSLYKVKPMLIHQLNEEMDLWVENGKRQPVLDFRKLNQYVNLHYASSDACDETLRRWRRVCEKFALLDLRCAYMQIHIDPILWKHQRIVYKEMQYNLTRLGFWLSSAPKIMSSILGKVLSLNAGISEATDHYIDDITIDLKKTSVKNVVNHLERYGLLTKEPEECDDSRVLGLQIFRNDKKSILSETRQYHSKVRIH
ncbi:uncharacterized protein LOC124806301 [Hydra vulgaris]|uniref:uncharacterized protein LOC124806301 n=1 Tax=Hydra vulgaris TaxID=6087 RepID=UPI001F5F9C70|nr:uncharacterized protein LOC124806301 [Hydra vulgaris]